MAVSGAGCSLAAAVTAELAKGATPLEAARRPRISSPRASNRVASDAPFDALWQGGPRYALLPGPFLTFFRKKSEPFLTPALRKGSGFGCISGRWRKRFVSGAGVGHGSHESRQSGFTVHDLIVERPVEIDGPLGRGWRAGNHSR